MFVGGSTTRRATGRFFARPGGEGMSLSCKMAATEQRVVRRVSGLATWRRTLGPRRLRWTMASRVESVVGSPRAPGGTDRSSTFWWR